MQLEEPEDLAGIDIDSPLWQNSKTLLRRPRYELAEVANPRGLVHHLVVPHISITLSSQKDHAGVWVKVGHEDPTGGVNVLNLEGLLQVLLTPDCVLPVRVFGKSGGEKISGVADEDNLGGLGAGVGLTLGYEKLQ